MVKRRSILLYPLSLIYGWITGLRNFFYDSNILRTHRFDLPVISVGNITVGGTGKTPHTEYLVKLLKDSFKIATLSRGYKRRTRGFKIAEPSSDVNTIGDEPLQIYRKNTDITVAVDADRVRGIQEIIRERPEITVVILDDAFQHRRISPGLSILLADFGRPVVKDYMLPYGNLREGASNMRRADVIIITKTPENISPIQKRIRLRELDKAPYQKLFFTSMMYLEPSPVFSKDSSEILPERAEWKKISIVLVTGIADASPFKKYLQKYFGKVVHVDFPDHHLYDEHDLSKIQSAWKEIKNPLKYIITTEKDAVRLQELKNIEEPFRSAFYYIPIGINFLFDEKDIFDKMILDYVRKNKRNSRLP